MIPVEQEHLAIFDANGDNVQRGDCLRACVASLFELPLSEVPHFVADEDWHGAYTRWLLARGLVLGSPQIRTEPGDPMTLRGRPSEGIYWIATVKSPRGLTRCVICNGEGKAKRQWLGPEERYVEYDEPQPCVECEASGLTPSLHAVVMCGGELVWDPHPQREMGHLGFVSGEWFILSDPARLAA